MSQDKPQDEQFLLKKILSIKREQQQEPALLQSPSHNHNLCCDREQIINQLYKKIDLNDSGNMIDSSFRITLIDWTPGFQVIHLNVAIQAYSMSIFLYSHKGRSRTHQLQNFSKTKNNIFKSEIHDKKIVIKCCPINEQNFTLSLRSTIYQFFVTKIASALKIGPSVDKIFGFDLILYDQCIEFGLEECLAVSKLEEDYQQLRDKLQKLHLLKIVHQDIKPDNIMFSPIFNQLVFIDYGISRVIREGPGQRTMTGFVGTLGFCSPQMAECLRGGEEMLDLYYNDHHCLQKSIQFLSKSSKGQNIKCPEFNEQLEPEDMQWNEWNSNLFTHKQKRIRLSFLLIYIKNIDHTEFGYLLKQNRQQFFEFAKALPACRLKEYIVYNQLSLTPLSIEEQYRQEKNQYQTQFNNNFSIYSEEQFRNISVWRLTSFISEKCPITITEYGQLINEKLLVEPFSRLINPSLADKRSFYFYYKNFIDYVDICGQPQPKEKKKAVCIEFLKIHHFTISCDVDLTILISVCFKYLLQMMLRSTVDQQIREIPNLLTNLLIFQFLSDDEIQKYCLQICHLNTTPLACTQIIFRCFLSLQWIKQRLCSRYKFSNIISRVTKIFYDQIIVKSERQKTKTKTFKMVLFIMQDQMRDVPCMHKNIENLPYRQNMSVYLYVQLLLCYQLRNMQIYNSFDDKSWQVGKCIEKINHLLRRHSFQMKRINYFTLKLINFATSMNIHFITQENFSVIESNFKDLNLIAKYKFYYSMYFSQICNFRMPMYDFILLFFTQQLFQSALSEPLILSIISQIIQRIVFQNLNHWFFLKRILDFNKITSIKQPQFQSLQLSNILSNKILLLPCNRAYQQKQNILKSEYKRLLAKLEEISCAHCLAHCQKYLKLLKAYILSEDQYQRSSIDYYRTIYATNKDQNSLLTKLQVQIVIFKAIFITNIYYKQPKQLGQSWQQTFNLIQSHQSEWICLFPYFHYQLVKFMVLFSLRVIRSGITFLKIQFRLAYFITCFDSYHLLSIINYVTTKFSFYQIEAIHFYTNGIKCHKNFVFRFLGIFLSACLRFQSLKTPQIDQIIYYIMSNMHFNSDIRKIVLGNVLYYKLHTLHFSDKYQPSIQQSIPYRRKRANLFRSYIKNDIFRLSLQDFMKQLLNLNTSPHQRTKKRTLRIKISNYYNFLKRKNEYLITKLWGIYQYSSPFTNQCQQFSESEPIKPSTTML